MASRHFRRAFVVGAYVPNGGTYMAYHLGQILQNDFGIDAIAVMLSEQECPIELQQPDNAVHAYQLRMPSVSIDEMSRIITDQDILIINPSFSPHLFGWKVPGFKLCYVQGFATYKVLDRKFDHYVAVSGFVQRFLRTVYDIDAPVIPAFINFGNMPAPSPWAERPRFRVLPYKKGIEDIWSVSYQRLRQLVGKAAPHIEFQQPFGGPFVPQRELLSIIGRYRYLLVLSAAEGMPLVPLEAMAMGLIVVGYDGFGGRQYFQPGVNCAVAPYAEIERVAALLMEIVNSPEKSAAMSAKARETALQYSYDAFRFRWLKEFSRIMDNRAPASCIARNGDPAETD